MQFKHFLWYSDLNKWIHKHNDGLEIFLEAPQEQIEFLISLKIKLNYGKNRRSGTLVSFVTNALLVNFSLKYLGHIA